MRILTSTLALYTLCTLGCGDDTCVPPPCPLTIAVELTITSAVTGSALDNVNLHLTAPFTADDSCHPASCFVVGGAGKYEIDISAPGFQTAHRSVTVTSTPPKHCGCEIDDTQHVSVALTPNPS